MVLMVKVRTGIVLLLFHAISDSVALVGGYSLPNTMSATVILRYQRSAGVIGLMHQWSSTNQSI
jgi:hypothetical protein